MNFLTIRGVARSKTAPHELNSPILPTYIMATRCEMCLTTARSCATKIIDSLLLCWISANRLTTCACTETSSAGRFIAHQQLGVECHRTRNADAPPSAVRELVWVASRLCSAKADLFEQFGGSQLPDVSRQYLGMDSPCLGNDLVDHQTRIEGFVGVLQYHLHPAPQPLQCRRRCGEDIVTIE